jgi:hypothetical protein
MIHHEPGGNNRREVLCGFQVIDSAQNAPRFLARVRAISAHVLYKFRFEALTPPYCRECQPPAVSSSTSLGAGGSGGVTLSSTTFPWKGIQ